MHAAAGAAKRLILIASASPPCWSRLACLAGASAGSASACSASSSLSWPIRVELEENRPVGHQMTPDLYASQYPQHGREHEAKERVFVPS